MDIYDQVKEVYDNSNLYNNEFANYDDDFTFWEYWIKKISPSCVLEIGIGNGRLLKLLSPMVKEYDGLELSKGIINNLNLDSINFRGNIYNQDMKKINIKKKYDLIILPFNTFVYLYSLDDIVNFFNGIDKISHENTIVIIDIFNPGTDDLIDIKKYRLCNIFNIEGRFYKLYEKHSYDADKQIITYYKKYVNNKKSMELCLPVRVFFHQELLNLIKCNGFDVINNFGDYNNEKYTSGSRKQIIFLKKRCK